MSITLTPLNIVDITADTARISDLTTCAIGGNGVFDKLMTSAKLYIEDEYNSNRITGKEYATVYLGVITGVMQSAIAFLAQFKEIEKLNAEIGLLRQKTVTELAATSDTLLAGLGFNNSTDIQGTTAKQNALYTAQTNGFARDAEQKLAKIIVDTWTVRRTTDDGTIASSANGLGDAQILEVLNKARAGIGL